MREFNIKIVKDLSEEECKATCLNYDGAQQCLSVDWGVKTKTCYLNFVNSQTNAVDKKCTSYNYHELQCDAGENVHLFPITNDFLGK